MLVEVAKVGDIAPGGMKFSKVGEREVVVCNCDGRYYVVSRRCGHMNSPLEMGTLDGTILTCPMHHVQFDVTTGEALNYPIPEYSDETLPEKLTRHAGYLFMLMQHISVCDIETFLVRIYGETIKAEID